MSNGILVNSGRIWKAELFKLATASSSPISVQGPFWCAVGIGDSGFTDPNNPPAEDATQTGLKNEKIRKKFTSVDFLTEESPGTVVWGARQFNVSTDPTDILLYEYLFGFSEANFTWKEIGIFGGDVQSGFLWEGFLPPTTSSGITGVTVNFVSPENGAGDGDLEYTQIGTTLTWQAPGSSTPGPAINVGGGGDFTMVDGEDATKLIRVTVASGSLPGSDTSSTPTLAAAGDISLNGLNSASNPTGQIAHNGRLIYLRNIPDRAKDSSSERPERLLLEL